jgi:hypothetical protein
MQPVGGVQWPVSSWLARIASFLAYHQQLDYLMEENMAKGQLRSNKEAKKPKKDKKPAPPAGGFLVPPKNDKSTNPKS